LLGSNAGFSRAAGVAVFQTLLQNSPQRRMAGASQETTVTVEIITPRDQDHWLQLRTQDVTSTESAALFGMSPYVTHFDLWHRKRSGQVPEFRTNERMRWGNRLESAIAHGIADEKGWNIEPMKDYLRDPEARIGSSFDFVITNLDGGPTHLEIKNVDYLAFRDGWLEHDDGSIEAPEQIELQVQHQMAVSGFGRAFIGAFVGGNRFEIIERQRDEDVIRAIRAKVAEFWRTVEAGEEPDPVMPQDAAALIRLNAYAEPGKILDATGDAKIASLVDQYRSAKAMADEHEEDAKIAKALLLEAIGDAEKVLLPGFSISAGMVADSPGTLITAEHVGTYMGGRKGYRNLRVTAKKAKA
jgi:putative phage-type endonuclease